MKNIIENFKNYQEQLNKSEKTIKVYVKEIQLFVKDYNINSIEDLKVMESKEFWNKWLTDMTSKYQANTVNKKKTALSVFSNYLIYQDIISSNKVEQLQNVKNNNKKIEVYSSEELDKILNHLENRINENNFQRKIDLKVWKMQRCIIHLLITSGMRISEVVKMKINDFDLSDSNVYAIRGKGYGGKISRKNAFNKEVVKELEEYLEIRKEIKIAEGDEEFLFISPLNKHHITDETVRKFVKRMFEEIGIKGTLHEFRHSKATDLIDKGVDVKKVSLFLGHSSERVTEMYYIKQNEDTMDELANL